MKIHAINNFIFLTIFASKHGSNITVRFKVERLIGETSVGLYKGNNINHIR